MVAGWALCEGLCVCEELVDIEIFEGIIPEKLLILKKGVEKC